jgi:hypothetical protein
MKRNTFKMELQKKQCLVIVIEFVCYDSIYLFVIKKLIIQMIGLEELQNKYSFVLV